jgi:hypothetical protein
LRHPVDGPGREAHTPALHLLRACQALQLSAARASAPPSPPRTKFASTAYAPDASDEIAALSAIGRALREVADGSSYVWYRYHGHLSGVVQPTASFIDATGRICRHILVILTTGARTGRVEGIACRLPDGNWQLEG